MVPQVFNLNNVQIIVKALVQVLVISLFQVINNAKILVLNLINIITIQKIMNASTHAKEEPDINFKRKSKLIPLHKPVLNHVHILLIINIIIMIQIFV